MSEQKKEVVITNIKMPFWSMVVFMVKWTLASIPAIIILSFVAFFILSIIDGYASF